MAFGDITGGCKLGEVGVCDPFPSFAKNCNYVSWIEGFVIVTQTDMGWKYHLDGDWHYDVSVGMFHLILVGIHSRKLMMD